MLELLEGSKVPYKLLFALRKRKFASRWEVLTRRQSENSRWVAIGLHPLFTDEIAAALTGSAFEPRRAVAAGQPLLLNRLPSCG